MADDTRDNKTEAVDAALEDMKIEESVHEDTPHANDSFKNGHSRSPTPGDVKSAPRSPAKKHNSEDTPKSEGDDDADTIGGDITVTVEPGKAPKLSRKSSQKIVARPATLFLDLPDVKAEATQIFQCIKDCIYGSKYMGSSDHDALDCDCVEEWNDGKNEACGEDSDCINRATKMECVDGDCNCGIGCQNQRFQRKQYANVSVIKTEKKGYGLRADTDLQPNDFIFEYIGEVINEPTFRRRMVQYDEEGIKHFYFMSLTKHEFVDATKKGNLGRFCNHSCNPNAYVDKWVVGDKLRMGIFAERHVKAGEELVFNYNVDRYGADPQPCYCGEPNCSGYIGGKTQTERATKLSHATIEALGIDDGDGWDTAVAKKPRKKKTGEDDEEYVNNVQPKGLDEEGVRKVMATLMQCKEKWIAVKLLDRIQRCDDDRVRNRVIQMHGYQILRATLTTWKEDNNVILQILDILYKFPRLTKNKISDSKIEASVEELITSEHEDVAFESKRLIEEWGKLEVAYRIPRKKFDPKAVSVFDRRNSDRTEEVKKEAIVAPTGPKSKLPQRNMGFNTARPPPRRPFNNLPAGWFTAQDEKGNPYYYSKAGQTTWNRPFYPAAEPPPLPKAPPKSQQTAKALQDIIDSITRPDPSSQSTPIQNAPTSSSTPKEKQKPVEKWRSFPVEKQMKIYENTLHPHVKHVMNKYTKKLPKDDLKKFTRECSKKLVASDFKNGRVDDPTKISEKQEKKVKRYLKEYLDKVVEKKRILDKRNKEKAAAAVAKNVQSSSTNGTEPTAEADSIKADAEDEDEAVDLTPNSPVPDIAHSPSIHASPFDGESPGLKRKRTGEDTPGDDSESKRLKDDISPPPPPPPPPASGLLDPYMQEADDANGFDAPEETEEEKELRLQQEELQRENEEAMKMDLDGSLKQEELELAKAQNQTYPKINGATNGNGFAYSPKDPSENINGSKTNHEGLVSR